jgi:hypothetical protein
MNALPEAGDLLIIPASYRVEHPAPNRAKTTTHRRITRPAAASHRRVAASPTPQTAASSYKTASLTVKRPATVN